MITPQQARDMLHYAGADGELCLTAELVAHAPVMAEQIASMRYEYAVEVVWGKNVTYAYKDDTGKGHFGPLAVWSWTRGEAAEFVAELKEFTPHTTARVVRRLASDMEVVE